jgi:hypothetical protein
MLNEFLGMMIDDVSRFALCVCVCVDIYISGLIHYIQPDSEYVCSYLLPMHGISCAGK